MTSLSRRRWWGQWTCSGRGTPGWAVLGEVGRWGASEGCSVVLGVIRCPGRVKPDGAGLVARGSSLGKLVILKPFPGP